MKAPDDSELQYFLLGQQTQALVGEGLPGPGRHLEPQSTTPRGYGKRTGRVLDVDLVAGQAIGDSVESAGRVVDFDGEHFHERHGPAFFVEALVGEVALVDEELDDTETLVGGDGDPADIDVRVGQHRVMRAIWPSWFSANTAMRLTALMVWLPFRR